jgi:hypothetical protein
MIEFLDSITIGHLLGYLIMGGGAFYSIIRIFMFVIVKNPRESE